MVATATTSEHRLAMSGRTAIVTGGGSGIGRATALCLGREGAEVAILDIDEEWGRETARMLRQMGVKSIFIRTDVSNESSAKQAIEATIREFGKLDTLINNAGVALVASITETTSEQWDRIIDTNLKGAFLMTKHAVPHLISAGGGAIINTASDAGIVGFANLGAYCASKGGLIQLTRALALEFGDRNIRVNAVAPTSTLGTRMVDAMLDSAPDPQRIVKALSDAHPLKRLGNASEVAELIVFLASERAGYITGAVFPIDGGITAACPVPEF
jgi:NAD(P)-dependent dehydrogenase (short-subunit alcohol dehydrogenase family)